MKTVTPEEKAALRTTTPTRATTMRAVVKTSVSGDCCAALPNGGRP